MVGTINESFESYSLSFTRGIDDLKVGEKKRFISNRISKYTT
jgi:hypothetical protein